MNALVLLMSESQPLHLWTSSKWNWPTSQVASNVTLQETFAVRRGLGSHFQDLQAGSFTFSKGFAKLVAHYINHLCQEGEPLTKAGWLLNGLKRLYPGAKE